MALPNIWQLLLPEFTFVTIIGVALILLGIFKNIVVEGIIWLVEKIFNTDITNEVVRGFMILIGVAIVWLPSIIADYTKTREGSLILVAVGVAIILIGFLVNRSRQPKVSF